MSSLAVSSFHVIKPVDVKDEAAVGEGQLCLSTTAAGLSSQQLQTLDARLASSPPSRMAPFVSIHCLLTDFYC